VLANSYVMSSTWNTASPAVQSTLRLTLWMMRIFMCNVRKTSTLHSATLNLDESKRASDPNYGFTMTRPAPSNSLAYGLIYSSKQLLCVTDSVKVFTHDCSVTPTSSTFCCNVKRLARYGFTPGFCPLPPKSKSPLKFTLCTLQSHLPPGVKSGCVHFVSKTRH
jgi:hypothetical protein